MSTERTTKIAYVGPSGAGLGFSLSGLEVHEYTSGEKAMRRIKSMKDSGSYGIIFVDEGLVEGNVEFLTKLNEDPMPAIILLPNPADPKHVAATNLQQLMVRAIGSDIFNS